MRATWARKALADKHAIWMFLAERDLDYADRVSARIDQRVGQLLSFPRLGRAVSGSDYRELSIPDTQHIIVYRIEDDVIRIMRLWSTRQDRREPS